MTKARGKKKIRDKELLANQFFALMKIVEDEASKGRMLKDGDIVKLDIRQIVDRPDYAHKNAAYREFVENNGDRVFTVKILSRTASGYPVIVTLEEDNTWSFWEGDLILVKRE